MAWAELVEQHDARAALKRAREAHLGAQHAGNDLTTGNARFYEGWALPSLGEHNAAVTALTAAALALEKAGDFSASEQARKTAEKVRQMLDGEANN